MQILLFLILLQLASLAYSSCPLQKVRFISEEFPPYNYLAEGGRVEGVAVDILVAASTLVNCHVRRSDIEILPWARGYKYALARPNTALFSMSFSEERSKLFLWAGPFAKTKNALIKKKASNIMISSRTPIHTFVIGAIRDDISHQLALAIGAKSHNFRFANHPDNLARMLYKDRIDMWAYNYITARWIFRKLRYPSDEFEIIYLMSENDNFFAFNKDTDRKAVQLLQQGINQLKAMPSGLGISKLEEIIRKYL
ncbi:substrate-binding periplasmic protein [Spartinivicinus poritis]|uniref:Transporter substrate-binding domain-containing protein n=1 Tax=Spartinivicinus poritis TaxID=2994640 RepID=A0ABT5UJG6_9GAMM|nr:transporter substrate-binding domain-containing protein [Spartinivicinus sp. A2-2]MDE1465672.1 transporter substrate-binding domain-containing protein [Spartinivicinus sp. A2-2]